MRRWLRWSLLAECGHGPAYLPAVHSASARDFPRADSRGLTWRGATRHFRRRLPAFGLEVNKTVLVEEKDAGRVFQITSQTRISKAGKPATLDDGVPGEEVAGSAREAADGKREALSVRFRPKASASSKADGSKKDSGKR